MDEKITYTFKKDYKCNFGTINKGRDITLFRGILYIDGIMIPEPYASDIKELFDDNDFIKEYIKQTNIIKNKV